MPDYIKVKVRQANRGTLAHQAGQHLHKHGPMFQQELFAGMGVKLNVILQDGMVQRAVLAGWLVLTTEGKIDCSAAASTYYDGLAGIVKVKPMGEIAAPRETNVFKQPPLSRRYMINSRGPRQDVPAWSQRPAGFGFKHIGGGEA